MPDENFNLIAEINQIENEQQTVLDHLEEIKQNADSNILPLLQILEEQGDRFALELAEIKRKTNTRAEIIDFSGS